MVEAAAPPELIRGKLYPPRPGIHQIGRDRLLRRLDAAADRALLLVCGPAGYGKSNLLSAWMRTRAAGSSFAWLSLDARDNDRDVFIAYLLAAVERACPGIELETMRLRNPLIPAPVHVVARAVSNDLDRLESDVWLVLDDYHVIDHPDIHALLLLLLEHPPPNLHLAVATRALPPWPLAALRARDQMAEVRLSDLRFTDAESDTFLRKALRADLPPDLVATFHDETEGWPAGLHLLTLLLHGQDLATPPDAALVGATDDIGAYLLAEVLAKQPPLVQERLCRLSMLERFSGELCEAICEAGPDDSAGWGSALLVRLHQANLFLVPLDAQHEFYRFHHLMQKFLVARLRAHASQAEFATLHRRASAWFAEHGDIEAAIDHALAADDPWAAGRLVARHRHALYNHEQFARLARWLGRLPTEVKEHDPGLLLAEARVATMHWRSTEAGVFLDRAERALADLSLPDAERQALLGELTIFRGILEFWDYDAERFVASARSALAVLPPAASHLRGLAHTGIAAGLYLQGDLGAAAAYLDAQLATCRPETSLYAELLQTKGSAQWIDSDLTGLQVTAHRLLNVSEALRLPDHEATALYLLGIVHYARNELAAAEHYLTKAHVARYTMRLLWWCEAAGALSLTYQALGQPHRAREVLEDAQAFLLEHHAVRILPNLGAFQAEVNQQQRRLADARTWAASVEPLPHGWSPAVIDPHLIQTRILLAQEDAKSVDRAAQLLAQMRAFVDPVPNRWLRMEVEATEALLFARQGDMHRALATLERVVLQAERCGWVRLFLDLGADMRRLLERLRDRNVAPRYVRDLLAAFPENRPTPAPLASAPHVPLGEPLSDRELDVLRLLAQRYSNKEIADALCIAPATVKTHTLNLYRKLDAADRREAVARAVEFGFVPMR